MQTHTKFLSIALLSAFYSYSLSAQEIASYDSYARGFKIVQSAFQEIGDRQNVGAIQNVAIKYQEFNSSRGQGIKPTSGNTMDEGGESTLIFDAANQRSYHQRSLQRRGRLFNPVIVLKDEGSFFYWPETKELNTHLDTDVVFGSFNFRFAYPQKLLPHVLLQNAMQNRSTIRWEGEQKIDGKVNDIVSFVHSDGSLITALVERETSLLKKTEELFNDFAKGDVSGEVKYSDYQTYSGVLIPRKISFHLSRELIREMKISSIEVNQPLDLALFDPPSGIDESDYQASFRPQRIAEGVFFMPLYSGTGIPYNSMFVVFDEYVMVLDAPLSDFLSHIYIQIIGQVAPGKPIKYVVPTHHHSDHIGGIRRFMAHGATIVASPGNESYFRQLSKVKSLLAPLLLSIDPDNLSFDLVKEKRVYADDSKEIEIYNVGPNPHAEEILIAYLAKPKVLYVTDLFWVPLIDGHYPSARETLRDFGKKIERLGLDVEVIVPGHGRVGTIEDLKNALNK
ncbi:MAG: MBL fold metallo-hydrolase [Cyclobacteriaceae bacterium]